MEYKDWYKLATWLNETRKGGYTEEEIAENAHDYMYWFENEGANAYVIKVILGWLIEGVVCDHDDESMKWLNRIVRSAKKTDEEFTVDTLLSIINGLLKPSDYEVLANMVEQCRI